MAGPCYMYAYPLLAPTFSPNACQQLAVAEERWDICEVLMKRGSDLYHYASDGM